MAVGKEIRTKIKSIQNTQKITRAMEMVAASKMRKAQDRMSAARPYADKIRNVVGHLAHAHPEYKHPFLQERVDAKRIGVIVVTTDRGLCGGLNSNLLRGLLRKVREWRGQNIELSYCPVGQKGLAFFNRLGGKIRAQVTHLGDVPKLEDLIGAVKVMLDAYTNGEVDRVYLVYNRFVSTMTQESVTEQLLPLPPDDNVELKRHWDYIYEPEAKEVLDALLTRYIEAIVYRSVVENFACEMAARMVAMKSASDNAGDLIGDLKLVYNKARQAAITQELSEIVSGAAAV